MFQRASAPRGGTALRRAPPRHHPPPGPSDRTPSGGAQRLRGNGSREAKRSRSPLSEMDRLSGLLRFADRFHFETLSCDPKGQVGHVAQKGAWNPFCQFQTRARPVKDGSLATVNILLLRRIVCNPPSHLPVMVHCSQTSPIPTRRPPPHRPRPGTPRALDRHVGCLRRRMGATRQVPDHQNGIISVGWRTHQ